MGPRKSTRASRGLNKVSKGPGKASRGRSTAELDTQNVAESKQGDFNEIPNPEDEILEGKESHQENLNEIPNSEDTQNKTLEQRITCIEKELRQVNRTRVLEQEEYTTAGEYPSRSPLLVHTLTWQALPPRRENRHLLPRKPKAFIGTGLTIVAWLSTAN